MPPDQTQRRQTGQDLEPDQPRRARHVVGDREQDLGQPLMVDPDLSRRSGTSTGRPERSARSRKMSRPNRTCPQRSGSATVSAHEIEHDRPDQEGQGPRDGSRTISSCSSIKIPPPGRPRATVGEGARRLAWADYGTKPTCTRTLDLIKGCAEILEPPRATTGERASEARPTLPSWSPTTPGRTGLRARSPTARPRPDYRTNPTSPKSFLPNDLRRFFGSWPGCKVAVLGCGTS